MSCRKFDYPLNLHISQTAGQSFRHKIQFDYPLNLHISQTAINAEDLEHSLIIL